MKKINCEKDEQRKIQLRLSLCVIDKQIDRKEWEKLHLRIWRDIYARFKAINDEE
jgi:hypothetical protein